MCVCVCVCVCICLLSRSPSHTQPPLYSPQVTVGVATSALSQVKSAIESGLAQHGVRANVIVSGHGDWR